MTAPISDDLIPLARDEYRRVCDNPESSALDMLEQANNVIDAYDFELQQARARIGAQDVRIIELVMQRDAMKAELAGVRADAGRYRRINRFNCHPFRISIYDTASSKWMPDPPPDALDAAIDAALKAAGVGG